MGALSKGADNDDQGDNDVKDNGAKYEEEHRRYLLHYGDGHGDVWITSGAAGSLKAENLIDSWLVFS